MNHLTKLFPQGREKTAELSRGKIGRTHGSRRAVRKQTKCRNPDSIVKPLQSLAFVVIRAIGAPREETSDRHQLTSLFLTSQAARQMRKRPQKKKTVAHSFGLHRGEPTPQGQLSSRRGDGPQRVKCRSSELWGEEQLLPSRDEAISWLAAGCSYLPVDQHTGLGGASTSARSDAWYRKGTAISFKFTIPWCHSHQPHPQRENRID